MKHVQCLSLLLLSRTSRFVVDSFTQSPKQTVRSSPNSPFRIWVKESNEQEGSSDASVIVADSAPIDENPSPNSDDEARSKRLARKRKMELTWCNRESCQEPIREKVVGEHNHMELTGSATGQVAYSWDGQYSFDSDTTEVTANGDSASNASPLAVLVLVKYEDAELARVAAEAIRELTIIGIQVLIQPTLATEIEDCGIDLDSDMIRLFEPRAVPGFGTGDELNGLLDDVAGDARVGGDDNCPADLPDPDLVVTLGGDGLLMYASTVFSGPVPPILPLAGGSMGFLTPFSRDEMVDAILISLGLEQPESRVAHFTTNDPESFSDAIELNVPSVYGTESGKVGTPLAFGSNNRICISMRMRLDCKIFDSEGSLRSRYNVLNEVVIDRGSSPYLASLECFCDDVHLTTVQADGIIFSTPTGSTAYSMAAGGSVVHPAVPAILVTPICPHVLSFRSMVFPDHVVLRAFVPSDARSTACVHFDGKHRTELKRGDSVQIEMSRHPVPTINRADHSSDWLSSLKRNFNFNSRVRQGPL